MRDDVPAWPPGASRSTTIVRSPSDAPYTAAARPAGPPPMITVSYSVAARRCLQAERARPGRAPSVERAPCRRPGAAPGNRSSVGGGSGPARRQLGRVGRQPVEWKSGCARGTGATSRRRRPSGADHHHARLGRLGRDALQPSDAARAPARPPSRRRPATTPRRRSTAGVDAQHARRLRSAVAAGNVVPSAIGTSPKIVPGSRQPSVRSTPSNILTTSILPERTA